MADLRDLIDAFDRLVAAASEVAPREAVEAAAAVARRARARRGFLGDSVVVALAGGTGSGKSSLVNALAGEEVAPTGARRPTTSAPLAWIPSNPEPGLVRLLDAMGIEERVGHVGLEWLAVLDLPDTDSVELANRRIVERLLPEVDAVVWVVDPEKYQDRALHREHLQPLADHAAQFRFVLNQVDRVPEDQVEALVADLGATLRGDGIADPVVVTTAADPPFGPPEGIEELIESLRSLGDAKRIVTGKLVADLDRAGQDLAAAAGVSSGGGTGFSEQWGETLASAAGEAAGDLVGRATRDDAARRGGQAGRRSVSLLGRSRPPESLPLPVAETAGRGVGRAVDRLDAFLRELAEGVAGETLADVRQVGASLDHEVAGAVEAVGAGSSIPLPAPPAWWEWGAWLRRLAAVAALVGAVWAVQAATGGDDLVPPVLLVAGALAVVVGLGTLASRSGRSWAVGAVEGRRQQVAEAVGRELDRRLGRPLRAALRERAEVAAAHAEYRLARARMDAAGDDAPPRSR